MNKFEINLNDENDTFDEKNDNIMSVSIVDNDGKKVPSKQVKVEIFLSKNAMIGLGTELIRRAIQNKSNGKHWHLDPTSKGDVNNACQEMGVFLHPDSPEVTIIQSEIGDLFKVLGKD